MTVVTNYSPIRVCVPRRLAAATIRGRCSKLIIVQRRWRLFEGGDYSRAATTRGRRLFEGGDYSRAVSGVLFYNAIQAVGRGGSRGFAQTPPLAFKNILTTT